MSDDNVITPNIDTDAIYEGKSFEVTPPGIYRMAVENISVRKTEKGLKKLAIFLTHVEEQNRKLYKGVNGIAMLEGKDKNGEDLSRQLGDFLYQLGFSKDDIKTVTVSCLGDLATADWKGVGAVINVRGDAVDLKGKEVLVKVVADMWQGQVRSKAASFYRVS